MSRDIVDLHQLFLGQLSTNIDSSCDPTIEECAQDIIYQDDGVAFRPALVKLASFYMINVFLMPILVSLLRQLTFADDQATIDNGTWTTLAVLHALVWFIPSVTLAIELGTSRQYDYLLGFSTDLSLFFIQTGVSNASFIVHIGSAFILLIQFLSQGFAVLYLVMALLYSGFAFYLEMLAWQSGVEAILYLDPDWENEHGDLLRPSLWYLIVGDSESTDADST